MSPIFVKVSGTWQEVSKVYRKVAGVWGEVTDVLVKVSGTWELSHGAGVPADAIILRDSATSPGFDWIIADGTSGTPDVTNGARALRIDATTLSTGGNATHSDDSGTLTVPTFTNTPGGNSKNKNVPCPLQSTHNHTANHTHNSDNDPARVSFVPFVGGNKIPAGTLMLYAGTDTPLWGTEETAYEGRIIGVDDTFSTSGDSDHVASFTGVSSYTSNTYSTLGWFIVEGEWAQHRHSIDHSHASVDITPSSIRLRLIDVTSDMSSVVPDMCFLTASATTPDGFTDITSTYSGKCIYVSATNTLVTIGADTHTHASEPFTTGGTQDDVDSGSLSLPYPAYTIPEHTHTFNHGHPSVSHVPEYITLRLIRKD